MKAVGAELVMEVGHKMADGLVEGDVRKWAPRFGAIGGRVKGGNVHNVACCFESRPCAAEEIRRKYHGIMRGVVRWKREGVALLERRRGESVGGASGSSETVDLMRASNATVISTKIVRSVRRFWCAR